MVNAISLFIRIKHNMHIFGVTPFIKLQNDKQKLDGEKQWKIRWRGMRANPFIGGWVGGG